MSAAPSVQVERLIGREEVERIRVFFYTMYCTLVERVKNGPSWYEVPQLAQGENSVVRRMDMEGDSAKVLACESNGKITRLGQQFPMLCRLSPARHVAGVLIRYRMTVLSSCHGYR